MHLPRIAFAFIALCAAPAANAGSTLAPGHASASLDFRIVIPAMVRAQPRAEPATLAVTAADVARGYVDVGGAEAVSLTSNGNSGFMLGIAFDTMLVSAVDIRIAEKVLTANETGTWVPVHMGRLAARVMRLGYRIFLVRGTHPGTYRWPVGLTYAPGFA
jgi:hypothetical protein